MRFGSTLINSFSDKCNFFVCTLHTQHSKERERKKSKLVATNLPQTNMLLLLNESLVSLVYRFVHMHVCLYVCTSISTLISAQKHFVANAFRNARHYFKCLEAFQAKMVNRKVMIERNGVALAPPSVCDRVCACTCPLVQASKQMITMPGACPNFPIRWNDDKSPLYIIYTYVRMYVLYVYNTIYRRHYIWIHHSAFVFITMACIDGRPLIVIRLIVIGLTVPRSFVTVIACRSTAQERW